jgi:hypothetical protein
MNDGGPSAGCGDRLVEPLRPVGFTGPDEAREPRHVVVAHDVKRIKVDPRSPDDLWNPARKGNWAERSASENRRIWVEARYAVAAVVVGVRVGEQRQARGGTDLEQGQGALERFERGKQYRAAHRFVGLRPSDEHHAPQDLGARDDQLVEGRWIG